MNNKSIKIIASLIWKRADTIVISTATPSIYSFFAPEAAFWNWLTSSTMEQYLRVTEGLYDPDMPWTSPCSEEPGEAMFLPPMNLKE